MEIKLPVSELKSALPALSKVVPRNSSLPVLRMLRVTRYESGTIQLQVTDIDAFASVTLEGQPGEPVDLLLAFDALARTAKGCSPTDHLTLIQTDAGVFLRHQIAGRPVERVVETLDIEEWRGTTLVSAGRAVFSSDTGSLISMGFLSLWLWFW